MGHVVEHNEQRQSKLACLFTSAFIPCGTSARVFCRVEVVGIPINALSLAHPLGGSHIMASGSILSIARLLVMPSLGANADYVRHFTRTLRHARKSPQNVSMNSTILKLNINKKKNMHTNARLSSSR